MRSTRTRRPGLPRGQRGMTIIEGLVSAIILLIGMLGVMRGIVVASQQNTIANHMTRAGAITNQIRVALENQGRDRFVDSGNGLFADANCIDPGDPDLGPLAGGLERPELEEDLTANWVRLCIVDLDTLESLLPEANWLVPGYSQEDRDLFQRVLVLFQTTEVVQDPVLGERNVIANQVGIVVSWTVAGERVFSRRFVGFYDSGGTTGNATRIDI